jgi:NAD(P)-dependent dehydrogenase (short-subunit alcohol dehydrogenase family)
MQNTTNEVVLINGVSNAVGQSVALSFGDKGATVAVVDRDKDAVERLVARLNEGGAGAIGYVADPCKSDEVKTAIRKVVDKYGKIDVLVNNLSDQMGEIQRKNTVEMTDADWSETISSGLNPLFYFCREVVSTMREKKYGRVINIGSLYYLGWPGIANHSAANSAMFGFTRALALETAIDNITANCVAVGDLASAGLPEAQVAMLTGSIPVGRLGNAQDVDNVVEFLASPASKYITGQTLFVCGGKSIHFSMSV